MTTIQTILLYNVRFPTPDNAQQTINFNGWSWIFLLLKIRAHVWVDMLYRKFQLNNKVI